MRYIDSVLSKDQMNSLRTEKHWYLVDAFGVLFINELIDASVISTGAIDASDLFEIT